MAVAIEETVLNALRGKLSEQTRLPAPKIIKIYISSRKKGRKVTSRMLRLIELHAYLDSYKLPENDV